MDKKPRTSSEADKEKLEKFMLWNVPHCVNSIDMHALGNEIVILLGEQLRVIDKHPGLESDLNVTETFP